MTSEHAHVSEAPDGNVLTLTDNAVGAVKNAMKREGVAPGTALRVGVVGGGCSGFSYTMSFDPERKPDDTVMETDGVTVLIDAASREYLQGITLDYVTGLHGAGFKFENPNASRTCGCGSSFA
jgi:iron-sulfur cluster assembly accessory protein